MKIININIDQNVSSIELCSYKFLKRLKSFLRGGGYNVVLKGSLRSNYSKPETVLMIKESQDKLNIDYLDEIIIDSEDSQSEKALMDVISLKLSGSVENGLVYLKSTASLYTGELDEVFTGNTEIISFNQLKYFTKITSLSKNAFANCTNLSEVELPPNLLTIGGLWSPAIGCFLNSGIKRIESLTVKTIGSLAFKGCADLEYAYFPECINTDLMSTFESCTKLLNFPVSTNITVINQALFSNCKSLLMGQLPQSITRLVNSCFSGCGKINFTELPENLLKIEAAGEFYNTKCNFINLPTGLNQIGSINGENSIMSFHSSASMQTHPLYNEYMFLFFGKDGEEIPDGTDNECLSFHNGNLVLKRNLKIGSTAFYGSTTVKTVDGASLYGAFTFRGCYGLTTIPQGYIFNTTANNSGFLDCWDLELNHTPLNINTLVKSVFRGCKLSETFIITNNITTMSQAVQGNPNNPKNNILKYLVFDNSRETSIKLIDGYYCSSREIELIDFPEKLDPSSDFRNIVQNVNSKKIKAIIFRALVPPVFANPIYQTYNILAVYVPQNSIESYKSAMLSSSHSYWIPFIKPLEGSPFENQSIDYDTWLVSYNGVPVELILE